MPIAIFTNRPGGATFFAKAIVTCVFILIVVVTRIPNASVSDGTSSKTSNAKFGNIYPMMP